MIPLAMESPIKTSTTQALIATGLTLVLALLVAAMYWSGLSGGFLLDDTPNLNVINQLPANPGLNDFLALATTGFAGILGRSISVFSFLLQYESWPDPRNFKLVNLAIHLINGCLLALCCVLIARQWRRQAIPLLAVAAVVFIWLEHPLQVSTVLYVVQRMTLLSTFFTLLAIIFYMLGRRAVLDGRQTRGLALLLTGLVPFALLAVLSKESGVLLYLYVLVLEYTLFESEESPPLLHRLRKALLAATVLIGIIGLLLTLPSTLEGYELKPFSFTERLFTQFPVLVTYIANILLLLPNYYGVFHDDFANGQGITLLISIAIVFVLMGAALYKRRQWPLFSFAVLWYFAGHALESTFLPLEYYFEHRNYLPLFGPIFALVVFLSDTLPRLPEPRRRSLHVLLAIALVFMSLTTVRQTTLWGSELEQAYNAVEHHPQSQRAQSNLVEKLTVAGQAEAAFDFHLAALDPQGRRIAPYIRWLEFSCILSSVELPQDDVLQLQARQSAHDYSAVFALNNIVFAALEGRCPNAPTAKLQLVLNELSTNPSFAVSRADIVFYQALLQAATENFDEAASLATDSFAERPDVRVGLYQINWLIRSGQIDLAERTLLALEADYEREISASNENSSRREFLRDRLAE